jgi:Zn-finger nucleic acid-binding protein
MRCPSCHHELRAADRLGVPMACCQACQGAWVGRGELSLLLARARYGRWGTEAPAPPRRPAGPNWPHEIEFYDFG